MSYASGVTYWDAFLPGLAIIFLAAAVLPWLDRENNWARTGAIALCLFLTWRYLSWRVAETLPPPGLTLDFISGVVFMAVEALAVVGGTLSLMFLMRTSDRTPEVERNLGWLRTLPRTPKVDVLICTYNEDETILERTILGALSLNYPNYRLWVCDDGRRDWLKELCARRGCGYITRPDNAHAKAGNINNALRYLATLPEKPEFVSILDADFVPKAPFLTRTLALMREPDVAVVQTPQHFFNADPIQTHLSLARVWPDEQRYFFDIVLAAKDAWGAAFCCGTSSLIRFAPLMAIGGFPTDSVTEDYLLTLRLKERGYRTVYLNEILSVGLAPEGLREYNGQRARWALGFIQICRGKSSPLKPGNGLKLIDRLSLIETFLHWTMSYSFRILAVVMPAIYLLFGIQALYANVGDAVSYFAPYFVAQIAVVMWLSRGRVMPIMSDLSQLLCAGAILKSVSSGLTKSRGHSFKVTAKGRARAAAQGEWRLLASFLVYLALTVAGILWAYVLDDTHPIADAATLALVWSWYNLALLVLACIVAVGAANAGGHSFAVNRVGALTWDGGSSLSHIAEVSEAGMRVTGPAPAPVGAPVHVQCGDLSVHATVAHHGDGHFGLRFVETLEARVALIRHVYAGPYHASIGRVRPARVAVALLNRVLH